MQEVCGAGAGKVSDTLHPRLGWHLENWARYVTAGGLNRLGCKTASIWGGSVDFDDLVDEQDLKCAIAVDSLVAGLPLIERIVMQHKHIPGCSVWRSNREPVEVVYLRAREGVSKGLRIKGIW
jgi:hypothetical protein